MSHETKEHITWWNSLPWVNTHYSMRAVLLEKHGVLMEPLTDETIKKIFELEKENQLSLGL